MSNTTQQRLDAFRQQRRVQAGSLIITAFGDAILPRGGRIWLGSLIRLLEPLELNDPLTPTSVFRLAKEEWLRTETIGRRADYVLTPSGRRRFEEASRHIYAGQAPLWDRRWRLILVVGELEPKLREQLRGALFWQGFGALGADCFVHPSAELPSVLDALIAEVGHRDRRFRHLGALERTGARALHEVGEVVHQLRQRLRVGVEDRGRDESALTQ